MCLVEEPLSRAEAEHLLEQKVGGAFLIRKKSQNSDTYVISAKPTRDQISQGVRKYSHCGVGEMMFKDEKYYYLRKGEGFASLLELIVHHKEEFGLHYPVHHNGKYYP